MRSENARGMVFDSTVHIPNTAAYQPITAALIDLDDTKERLGRLMKPEALGEAVANSVEGRTATAVARLLYGTLLTNKRETAEAERRILERQPTDRDAEIRTLWRGLSPAEQAARLTVADVDELAAIHRHPELSNVRSELMDPIRDRLRMLNFIDRSQLSGSHPAKPSLTGELLAVGVDQDAVMRAAESALTRHKARLAQSASDEATLRDLVSHLAASFNMQPDTVLERIIP